MTNVSHCFKSAWNKYVVTFNLGPWSLVFSNQFFFPFWQPLDHPIWFSEDLVRMKWEANPVLWSHGSVNVAIRGLVHLLNSIIHSSVKSFSDRRWQHEDNVPDSPQFALKSIKHFGRVDRGFCEFLKELPINTLLFFNGTHGRILNFWEDLVVSVAAANEECYD